MTAEPHEDPHPPSWRAPHRTDLTPGSRAHPLPDTRLPAGR